MDNGTTSANDVAQTHEACQRLQHNEDLAEECRQLRRLQAFRARNACALISLPRSSCGRDTGRAKHTDDAAPPDRSSQHQEENNSNSQERNSPPIVTYRLRHLTCSMTPTVSVHKLDHTRPGHPSDTPPSLDARALRKAGVPAGGTHDIMLTRLIIPNISPTSIRCADHHRPSMAPAGEQGREGEASMSIAHQRAGLSVTVDRTVGNQRRSRIEEGSSSWDAISRGSGSTGNTGLLSPT